MNIALVDLNLLVVFDAVMREKNVTRASKRIGITQPAVSNALNRLRHLAKDDLFVRTSQGVVPTARAINLAPPIRQAIKLVENAFDPTSFNPGESYDKFNIAISNYTASIIFPELAEVLEQEAPNIDIRSKQLGDVDLLRELEAANIDFIIAGQQLIEGKKLQELPVFIEYAVNMPNFIADTVIGVRTSQYKYFRDKDDPKKKVHLFDLENDPLEENNIAEIIDPLKKTEKLDKNALFIVHRHKKSKDIFPESFKILDEKKYGLSKIIFGN